jgi:Zn/Cd-binding protein ZinT
MKFKENQPPRVFQVGTDIQISDCGKVELEANEMLTFVSDGKEYDFTAKSWGYYVTSSINGRVARNGYKTALVKNSLGKYFIMAVKNDKVKDFELYLAEDGQELLEWLDERE